jgi:predicted Rdx family selenoprotein
MFNWKRGGREKNSTYGSPVGGLIIISVQHDNSPSASAECSRFVQEMHRKYPKAAIAVRDDGEPGSFEIRVNGVLKHSTMTTGEYPKAAAVALEVEDLYRIEQKWPVKKKRICRCIPFPCVCCSRWSSSKGTSTMDDLPCPERC